MSIRLVGQVRTTAGPNNDVTLDERFTALCKLADNPAFTLAEIVSACKDVLKQIINPVGLDDRLLLLEQSVVLMSKLARTDSEDAQRIQQTAINILFKDLPHPPSGYLSLPPTTPRPASLLAAQSRVNYAFRFPDGSYNDVLRPTFGQAGSPYARSVPSSQLALPSALPDPGLLFDTLLKRPGNEFFPHPGGLSSLFFAFADLVIHSIFSTNPRDWSINDTSSYLDLSVLYGNNDAQVDSVRRKDGSGKLWDDVFADSRLLFMPPASCALLVLLSRNHNYIAQRILDINENGNFVYPLPTDESQKQKQDDELFHRARLVNCGFFMHIILGDYVGAILGLVRDGSSWRLDPLMTMRDLDHSFVPVGQGNVVSVEFNLLYRWHSAISASDTAWTTKMFDELMNGENLSEVTVDQFASVARSKLAIPIKDVKNWTFNGLERDANGRFKDADLANILHNSTEARAGAFRARGIPEALRVIEIMGIQQARSWGTCSLNEFRKFLGLKQYSTFEEWNPDPEIHTAAAALYKDINNLELYVGLQAEETKVPGPGAGLCPGYTISRAILADAVNLTRNDRFMTVDFNPFNLTSWGYQDCQYDPQDGSYGGLLTKLLFRTLPDYYPTRSAYAHFPFLDPLYMKDNLEKKNPALASKYIWTRPRPHLPTIPIDTFEGVRQILTEPDFASAYDDHLFTAVKPILTKMEGERLNENDLDVLDEARKKLISGTAKVFERILSDLDPTVLAAYFSQKTEDLIKTKSFKHVGKGINYVDVVRDVINLVPVHWVSEKITGLPLKTGTEAQGDWSEQGIYEKFAAVAQYVYLDTDPGNDWHLRETAQQHSTTIVNSIHEHVDSVSQLVSLGDVLHHDTVASHKVIKSLWKALGKDYSRMEIASQIFAAVVPSAAFYSQAVCTVVHYYLAEDKKAELEEIIKLGGSSDRTGSGKVMAYVYEALKQNPLVAGVYRTATKDVSLGPVNIQVGQQVFASISKAIIDSSAFGPNAAKSVMWSPGNGLLATKFFEITVPAILSSVFKMKDIATGPGQSGSFNHFTESRDSAPTTQYINTKGLVTPWPESLVVQYCE